MAVRLLHRLRIFTAVFAPPPATAGGALPSEDAFGSAACSLTVEAFDAMQVTAVAACCCTRSMS